MLLSTQHILGHRIRTTDDEIGEIRDFYCDDREWSVRYLVADTGTWLSDRRVILAPVVVDGIDGVRKEIRVTLTKEEVEESPQLLRSMPLTREDEDRLASHFTWPRYWAHTAIGGGPHPGPMAPVPPASTTIATPGGRYNTADSTVTGLRSLSAIEGVSVEASNGSIGNVKDFIVADDTWRISYFVVDTGSWFPGRKVLVSPAWVEGVDWPERALNVNLTQEQVKNSPEFDPTRPVNRQYEEVLYDFYGRPKYW